MVGLRCGHEVFTAHIHLFTVLQVFGVVLQRKENSTAAPAELVAWIMVSRRSSSSSNTTSGVPRGLSESKTAVSFNWSSSLSQYPYSLVRASHHKSS